MPPTGRQTFRSRVNRIRFLWTMSSVLVLFTTTEMLLYYTYVCLVQHKYGHLKQKKKEEFLIYFSFIYVITKFHKATCHHI